MFTEEQALEWLNLYTCGQAVEILADETIKPKLLEIIEKVNSTTPLVKEVVEFLFFRLDNTIKAEMIGLLMGNIFNDLPKLIVTISQIGDEKNA